MNTTKLQEYFVAQTAEAWGLSDETCCGPATGGRLRWASRSDPDVGANTLTIGDAAGAINPFNGEGIAYGYETGRLAAGVLGRGAGGEGPARGSPTTTSCSTTAYGDYYKVARAFVRLISEPRSSRSASARDCASNP